MLGFLGIAVLFAAFASWIAITVSWSTVPRPEQAIEIGAIFLTGLLFVASAAAGDTPSRKLIRAAGVACVGVLAAALFVEAVGDMPMNRMAQPTAETGMLMRNPGKGASVLVVFVWGALGALMGPSIREGWKWQILLVAAALMSFQFDMAVNAIAFLFGLGGFILGHAAPRFTPIFISGGIALWMLAAPFAMPILITALRSVESLPLSWKMRLEIWAFALARIREKPIMGWGLDSVRGFKDIASIGDFKFPAAPLHTHSASLHVWLETGAIGAILAAAAIIGVGVATARTLGAHPAASAAACGAMAAVGAIWNVSYGAWQEWWMVVPFAAAGLAAAARR
jgi:O-antigen ligase